MVVLFVSACEVGLRVVTVDGSSSRKGAERRSSRGFTHAVLCKRVGNHAGRVGHAILFINTAGKHTLVHILCRNAGVAGPQRYIEPQSSSRMLPYLLRWKW